MVLFFFYNYLTDVELIKKINDYFEISDGYIIIQNDDSETNSFEISNKTINTKLLYGKIVHFNVKLNDVINKMNEMEECKLEKSITYKLTTIWARIINTDKTFGGISNTYIIY